MNDIKYLLPNNRIFILLFSLWSYYLGIIAQKSLIWILCWRLLGERHWYVGHFIGKPLTCPTQCRDRRQVTAWSKDGRPATDQLLTCLTPSHWFTKFLKGNEPVDWEWNRIHMLTNLPKVSICWSTRILHLYEPVRWWEWNDSWMTIHHQQVPPTEGWTLTGWLESIMKDERNSQP